MKSPSHSEQHIASSNIHTHWDFIGNLTSNKNFILSLTVPRVFPAGPPLSQFLVPFVSDGCSKASYIQVGDNKIYLAAGVPSN